VASRTAAAFVDRKSRLDKIYLVCRGHDVQRAAVNALARGSDNMALPRGAHVEQASQETGMSRHRSFEPQGVIPAVLLPFHEDLSIDEQSYRAHLRDVAQVEGLSALTINAHSSEVASCTFDEQRRVLDVAQEEVGSRLPLINGVYADGSLEAARIARMAHEGGASALLVFPPGVYNLGQRPEMAVEHFRRIAAVTDLPLIAFQYPLAGGFGYPLPTLLQIIETVPTVRAIKDWCMNPQLHEQQIRTLRALTPPIHVLSTHSAWLMSSLVLGCDGLLSGSGSVIADLQARLFHAVQAQDLAAARTIYERIWPTAEVFYAHPWVDMHNRMKEALVLLGRLPRAVVRPPLVKIDAMEIDRIRRALVAAGLLSQDARQRKTA
jgi:4-hydroxy-tetrahydrodipicolinate synthase